MVYLFGIVLDFCSKVVISVANVFDGQLARKTFGSVWSLVALNGLLLIPFIVVLFFIVQPSLLVGSQFMVVLTVAAIEFLYQVPYYQALRQAETSVVMSLFSLEKIFVPLLAYWLVQERLTLWQYVGFGIIVVCSLATTFDKAAFRMNKAILYMVPVTGILALSSVLQKYSLNQLTWSTFYFWSLALSVPFYLLTLAGLKTTRHEIAAFLQSPFSKKYIPLYGQNIATWISGGLGAAALAILPVTITKAIGSFHALIVHLVAAKGAKQLRVDQVEHLSLKRLLLFSGVGLGVFLTLFAV